MHPYACFDLSGNVQDTPRASRSCVTTGAQDNRLRSQHLQDRFRQQRGQLPHQLEIMVTILVHRQLSTG